MSAPPVERRGIVVGGIVQGVGFRPFIHSLATKHGLSGLVRNDARGVQIEVEGTTEEVDRFVRSIEVEAPPLAVVETVVCNPLRPQNDFGFRIEDSAVNEQKKALVAPDSATCADCLAELFDRLDRRFRYPFINCTNCGPRFTITRSVPYDRAVTTMSDFHMCASCSAEYHDVTDRRFHAQPNACPRCGPEVQLLDRFGREPCSQAVDPILRTAELIGRGAIVAIKGIGGYHLACDPFNAQAVSELRNRKVRQDKPFALMARDLAQIRRLCHVTETEIALLTSSARPIVLLERLQQTGVAAEVAPRQKRLGIMLAYTPLHHLLLHDAGAPLVMTSGNRCDEPIAYRDEEVLEQLRDIADYFLVHNRPIHTRCDDSVTVAFAGHGYPSRRSRGYAPAPLGIEGSFEQHVLACGGHLKNTFCLAKDNHAFVSHHIGDLENYETFESFKEGIRHYSDLFDVRPAVVACDLHPEYLSSKYAKELEESGLPTVGIQHHHAHVASCIADNGLSFSDRLIGVALDGTGYGTDGTIWGGEFFEGSVQTGFSRCAHLDLVPMPGGEAAIKHPWQMAVAYLSTILTPGEISKLPLTVFEKVGARKLNLVTEMVRGRVNSPLTSSAGRLFDAVAALLDLPGSGRTTYEGQPAIELELVTEKGRSSDKDRDKSEYRFRLRQEQKTWVIETAPVFEAILDDVLAGDLAADVSLKFHRALARIVLTCCQEICKERGLKSVALSGGCFQNMILLSEATQLLQQNGFIVYQHRRVPTNDGGLSLGQAVLAKHHVTGEEERGRAVCA